MQSNQNIKKWRSRLFFGAPCRELQDGGLGADARWWQVFRFSIFSMIDDCDHITVAAVLSHIDQRRFCQTLMYIHELGFVPAVINT